MRVSDNYNEIESFIKKYFENAQQNLKQLEKEDQEENNKDVQDEITKIKNSTLLIQKYLEAPLLYQKRKFDIRMWVLITHKMEVYIFK